MEQGFKGMSFPFRFNGSGGTATSTTNILDFTHISESIRQIVGTRVGERINEINFGCEAVNQTFASLYDETNLAIIKFLVMEAVQKYEPRVVVEEQDITFTQLEEGVDGATLVVDVAFTVIQYMKKDRVTIKL